MNFTKMEGTGNDFVLIDDRQGRFPGNDIALIRHLCDRHLGIGSDGLILVQAPRVEGTDMHMEFHNPDGSRSFCGNGSRCAFAFWSRLSKDAGPSWFTAIDGSHEGEWVGEEVSISLPAMPCSSPDVLVKPVSWKNAAIMSCSGIDSGICKPDFSS